MDGEGQVYDLSELQEPTLADRIGNF